QLALLGAGRRAPRDRPAPGRELAEERREPDRPTAAGRQRPAWWQLAVARGPQRLPVLVGHEQPVEGAPFQHADRRRLAWPVTSHAASSSSTLATNRGRDLPSRSDGPGVAR